MKRGNMQQEAIAFISRTTCFEKSICPFKGMPHQTFLDREKDFTKKQKNTLVHHQSQVQDY